MLSYPILWESGVYLPEQGLWLDPKRPRPRAVISHAHSDHVAAHPVAYATPATRRLVGHRRPRATPIHGVPYGERLDLGSCHLTFHPAGHVLGSAQTLLETPFGRVLYTGDLKTRPGFTSEAAPVVPADVLVLESTFGKPHYRFPQTSEVLAGVISWCRNTLELGSTPILLGYSLGKGQEILSALSAEGFEICLHPALFAITDVYRELGCAFPPYRCFSQDQRGPMVVIAPTLGGEKLAAAVPAAFQDGGADRLGDGPEPESAARRRCGLSPLRSCGLRRALPASPRRSAPP